MSGSLLIQKKKEIVSSFLKASVLVGKDVLELLKQDDVVERWHIALSRGEHPNSLLISDSERSKNSLVSASEKVLEESNSASVNVFWEYDDFQKKRTVQDFIDYFNARFRQIEKMLQRRGELQNLTSIARIKGKREKENVSVIGIVMNKQKTKNEHWMLTLEDSSGMIRVLVSKSRDDVYGVVTDLVLDEVIGVNGSVGDNIIFADQVITPDIPIQEVKKSPDEVFACVLSCVHVGSAGFEEEKFIRFINWVNGEYGSEKEREIAKKLKYVFICGDLVDGVGIYPGQDEELSIKNIRDQYKECARLLSLIRKDVHLILGPGNHDVGRISEPQPKLSKNYAGPLYDLPNATLVTNPAIVTIHESRDFSGFSVLMYHGYSFDDYGEIVPSIRDSGKHLSDRAPLIMRFLLQRRHLGPQHTSTLYIPDPRFDPLVIEKVPDLFVAGHIHKAGALQYRSATCVCGSCFQKKTAFQEKVGHEPEPGVVPVINLKTREVGMVKF